jgi:hypothetical protein
MNGEKSANKLTKYGTVNGYEINHVVEEGMNKLLKN